jgi:dTDP-4-dehydrorhamnose 3,5-epimerase
MKVTPMELPEVLLIEPAVWTDPRGFFFETFHEKRYAEHGIGGFVQDNFSRSVRGTLRGLHYQQPNPQGKLVQVLSGSVFDVAVDIRRSSPRFGRWCAVELSGENKRQLWIPPGFAHGFFVTSESADFHYKCTALYDGKADRSIRWDDPAIGVKWPDGAPLLSRKDAEAPLLKDAVLPD